jgi:hypothetical protein
MVFGAEEIVFSKFENVEVQSELDENGQMYLCGSFGKRKSYTKSKELYTSANAKTKVIMVYDIQL